MPHTACAASVTMHCYFHCGIGFARNRSDLDNGQVLIRDKEKVKRPGGVKVCLILWERREEKPHYGIRKSFV